MAVRHRLLLPVIKMCPSRTPARIYSSALIDMVRLLVRLTCFLRVCTGDLQYLAWLAFGRESLAPLNYSLVVQGGSDGFACYTHGNDLIFDSFSITTGYTDGGYPFGNDFNCHFDEFL